MTGRQISALDRGFLFGDGVFDTMIVVDGRMVAGDAHVDRLCRHAAGIGMTMDRSRIENGLAAALSGLGSEPAIVRTTVSRGVTARGLWPSAVPAPTIEISVSAFDPSLIGRATALVTSEIPRNHRSPIARIKSLNYLDNILATRDAQAAGADEALLLNTDGNVACSTMANLFALVGTTLMTPPSGDGAMDGTVRASLLADPPDGLTAIERSLTPDDVRNADAVFLTNSVRLSRPVRRLDDRTWSSHPLETVILNHLQARLLQRPLA